MQGRKVKALIDTGAQVSLMSYKLYEQLDHRYELTSKLSLEGIVQDVKMEAKLCEGVKISLGGKQFFKWKFYVTKMTESLIIVIDFLCYFKAILNFSQCTLTLNNASLRIPELKTRDGESCAVSQVLVSEMIEIPPNTVMRTMARLNGKLQGDVVISPTGENNGALIPSILVTIGKSCDVPIQLVNDTALPIKLRSGHVLGNAMPCDQIQDDVDHL